MERPILFSTPMIQAILAGTKTQTRRIVKDVDALTTAIDRYNKTGNWTMWYDRKVIRQIRSKYNTGDILWVRETFIDLQKTPVEGAGSEKYKGLKYWYRADNARDMEVAGRYKPSIFMPKVACRIKLLIKNIGVERLNDISKGDAIAEGITELLQSAVQLIQDGRQFFDYSNKPELFNEGLSAKESYKSLWESINGKDSWDKNPWIWKITFDKL